jgi:hypothetical protein
MLRKFIRDIVRRRLRKAALQNVQRAIDDSKRLPGCEVAIGNLPPSVHDTQLAGLIQVWKHAAGQHGCVFYDDAGWLIEFEVGVFQPNGHQKVANL